MSHVAGVDVKVTDLDALKDACAELGFRFNENAKTYRWWNSWVGDSPIPRHLFSEAEYNRICAMSKADQCKYMTAFLSKCDHSISVPGADYEIAVRAMGDGTYSLGFDWYGQQRLLTALGGEKAPKLVQGYAAAKVKAEARRYGHIIESEERLADGTIRMRLLASHY